MSSASVPGQDFKSLPYLSSQGAYSPCSHTSPDRNSPAGAPVHSHTILAL